MERWPTRVASLSSGNAKHEASSSICIAPNEQCFVVVCLYTNFNAPLESAIGVASRREACEFWLSLSKRIVVLCLQSRDARRWTHCQQAARPKPINGDNKV